jgi:hypothetical protein
MSKCKWPFRPSAVKRAVKTFEESGKIVTSAEIDPATGKIVLCFSESGAADVGANEWDDVGLINGVAADAVR